MVLHPDTGALFKQYVSEALMDKMTSGEGHLHDKKSNARYYYYSFTNPDWFVIYRVSGATLTDITRHETTIVGWGLRWRPSSSSFSAYTSATPRVAC